MNLHPRPKRVLRSAIPVAMALVAGCATQAVELPKPKPREEPINSLALEQCLKVNGPERCAEDGN